jgi:hypothetical protein
MSKSYVIIEQPDKMAIYVVVLTKEGTATFWDDLSREIVGLHKPNSRVYFDYLFRNGLNNRVFSSHTDENSLCSLAIEPLGNDILFDIYVFNSFYNKNIELIRNSRLTSIQKILFMKSFTSECSL